MTRSERLEAAIAGHTARHLAATTYCQPGRSHSDAAQMIESLHTRAQRRAERSNRLNPRTVALRRRLLAVLHDAGALHLSTKEICERAGLNNFEHHAYAYPQLCALATLGVITRTPPDRPNAVHWRYNRADQTDDSFNAGLAQPRRRAGQQP